jgi:threonine synthase
VARLIPQAVYYTAAAGKAPRITMCVPSGNFGNLTAGLYAMKMGAPVRDFIAATNSNKTVPDYLASGNYEERPSLATISNAMDVGAPSNFERMRAHFSLDQMRQLIRGASVTDDDTRAAIKAVHERYGYVLDPHGAVGWQAVDQLRASGALAEEVPVAVLATAHPAKFAETVECLTGPVPVPDSLKKVMERPVLSQAIPAALPALLDLLR